MDAFKKRSLYVITDPRAQRFRSHLKVLSEAVRGGASIVQLRDKEKADSELIAEGKAIRGVCDQFGALLIVNERIEVAEAIGADGIHIGQEDIPVREARGRIGKKLLGVSTHNLEQARRAEQEGADYIGVGPIFKTPTKPDYPPVGISLVKEVRNHLSIPFVAIGGIDLSNAAQVLEAGADGLAVVRAVVAQENVYEATKQLTLFLESFSLAPSNKKR